MDSTTRGSCRMSGIGRARGGQSYLSALFATSAVALMAMAGAAAAQTAPAPADSNATALTEIVVTGSRIRSEGFTAPTPTQALGQADLERAAQPNIFTAITQLP